MFTNEQIENAVKTLKSDEFVSSMRKECGSKKLHHYIQLTAIMNGYKSSTVTFAGFDETYYNTIKQLESFLPQLLDATEIEIKIVAQADDFLDGGFMMKREIIL